MTSDGLTGPERSISSIQTAAGTNTEAVLALGAALSEQMDDHDMLGRWMAHHLAELVSLAGQDATPEQHLQIVDIILRLWSHRRYLPIPTLKEFEPVLAALTRLGDDRPWAFSQLGFGDRLSRQAVNDPLLADALDLERLTRQTILRLLLLATRRAVVGNRDVLQLAEQIEETLEVRAARSLRRLRSLVDPQAEAKDRADATEADDDADILDWEDADDDTLNVDQMSPQSHAEHLRTMAARLIAIADELTQPTGRAAAPLPDGVQPARPHATSRPKGST